MQFVDVIGIQPFFKSQPQIIEKEKEAPVRLIIVSQ